MKKSIETAKVKAKDFSIKHPTVEVRVMDKPGRIAQPVSCGWVYKELVLEGWCTVAIYRGGERVDEH